MTAEALPDTELLTPVDQMREAFYGHIQEVAGNQYKLGSGAQRPGDTQVSLPADQSPFQGKQRDGQELVGVIKAQSELFGVVRRRDSQGAPAFLLTRFTTEADRGADIVGVIGEEGLQVGRTSLGAAEKVDVDTGMSRQHFLVKLTETGVDVQDTNSLNGTTVITADPNKKSGWMAANADLWAARTPEVEAQLDKTPVATGKALGALVIGDQQPEPEVVAVEAPDSLLEQLQKSTNYHVDTHHAGVLRTTYTTLKAEGASEKVLAKASEILANGTLDGKEIGMNEVRRGGNDVVRERRWMATMVHAHPEIAQTLVDNEIVGFHATGSFALAGVVEDGMLFTGRELHERGKASITGAHDADKKGTGQTSISFGTMQEVGHNVESWSGAARNLTSEEVVEEMTREIAGAAQAAGAYEPGVRRHNILMGTVRNLSLALEQFKANPNSLRSTMMKFQFPVAVGITREFVRESEARRQEPGLLVGQSYFGEFRVGESVPKGALPVMAVPRDKIKATQQVLKDSGYPAKVVALEDLTMSMSV